MSEDPNFQPSPETPAPPAPQLVPLYLTRPVEHGGKKIAAGEVIAEITVHPNSSVAHAISVMRNGFTSLQPTAPRLPQAPSE
jgi:hypothetical protein